METSITNISYDYATGHDACVWSEWIGNKLITSYMSEEQLQAQCFQWHWNTYPEERGMLYHNDNNSFNRIEGNKKKALGVVPGVSDYTLIVPDLVIWLEFKIVGGRHSDDQKAWADKIRERGQMYITIFSFVEFKELIYKFYGKR